ncbi:hypothetical protein PM082_006670 [Marasmius tenuissimus]|nr:hypothetical protein PM082_006670 [Marasmius tenuissimus]
MTGSQRRGSTTNGSNSPIPDDEPASRASTTPRNNQSGNENTVIPDIGEAGDPNPIATLSEKLRGKQPENVVYPPVAPVPTYLPQFAQTYNQAESGLAGSQEHDAAPTAASNPEFHSRVGTLSSNKPRRTTTALELSQYIDELRTSVKEDFLTIGTKFSIELAKVQTAHERRFETVASYVLGVEESIDPTSVIPLSPLNTKVSTGPILKQDFLTTIQKIDEAINAEIITPIESRLSNVGVTHITQQSTPPPVASSSRVQLPTVVQPVLPTEPIRKPRSPFAATVMQVPDEDEVLYHRNKQTNKPSDSANETLKNENSLTWKDRVNAQRMRNHERRETGHSSIQDQGIGFDEDAMPVDKATTPREVWDRDYREALKNFNSTPTGSRDPTNFTRNNRDHSTNHHWNYTNDDQDARLPPPPPGPRGIVGGNPGDPGGDSSDSDSNRGRPPKKDDGGKRRRTPWGDESSDENYDSEYSTDSLYSYDESIRTSRHEGKSKAERRRKIERAARRHEIEKLEDFARRRWTKRIHHKYRTQIREQVGSAITSVDGLKSIKISEPTPYDGKADVEVFDTWLLNILRWIIINKMSGPDMEHIRVQVTGMLLTGKALIWYNDEVAGAHRFRTQWTFEDVVIGLFDHCVQSSTIHEAADKFDAVTYDPKVGIREYYNTLTRWAYRMLTFPDKFTFKRRFVDGLPKHIVQEMIDRGAVPDYSDVETMIRAVQRYEDDIALKKYYLNRKNRPESSGNTNNHSNRYQTHGPDANNRSRPQGRPDPARMIGGKRFKPARRSRSRSKDRERTTTRKPGSGFKFGQFKSNNAPPKGDKPKVSRTEAEQKKLCFGCGQSGHYANDPTCSRYGQPRLFAIGEDHGESDQEHGVPVPNNDSESPEAADNPQGSSSEGEYTLEEYEDYGGYINGDESESEDWLGSIPEVTTEHTTLDDFYNPLLGSGPPVMIEDNVEEECFPTLDLNNNDYKVDDQLYSIENNGNSSVMKVDMRLRRSTRTLTRPSRGSATERRPLVALVKIAGQTALTLFDSGCTLECLSPGFARVANIKVHQLAEQHSLQLGTIGSRAKFNYGTVVNTEYSTVQNDTYFDIVNIDRYDAIIGTYYMRKHGIQLDFEHDQILIRGKPAPTLSVGEDSAELKRRSAMRRELRSNEFQRKDNPN